MSPFLVTDIVEYGMYSYYRKLGLIPNTLYIHVFGYLCNKTAINLSDIGLLSFSLKSFN